LFQLHTAIFLYIVSRKLFHYKLLMLRDA
jgi:hypothetical protein